MKRNSGESILMRVILVAVVASLLCLQSGCMTAGEQLDRSAIGKLQKGQTLAEVRQIFGTPKRTETGANGKRLDVYQISFVRNIRSRFAR